MTCRLSVHPSVLHGLHKGSPGCMRRLSPWMRCQQGHTQGGAASSACCCATCGTSGTGVHACITLSSTFSLRLKFGSPFRQGQPSGTLTTVADRFLNWASSAGQLTATGWTAFGPTPLVNRQDIQEAHLWSDFLNASVYALHSVRCPSCQPARQAAGQLLRDALVLFQITEHYLLRENSTAAGTVGITAASHPSTMKVRHTLQQHALKEVNCI